jgi:hypothetical protein
VNLVVLSLRHRASAVVLTVSRPHRVPLSRIFNPKGCRVFSGKPEGRPLCEPGKGADPCRGLYLVDRSVLNRVVDCRPDQGFCSLRTLFGTDRSRCFARLCHKHSSVFTDILRPVAVQLIEPVVVLSVKGA